MAQTITTQIDMDDAYHLMKTIEGLTGKSKREDFRLAVWSLRQSDFCRAHQDVEYKISTLLIQATDTRIQATKQTAIDEIIAYIKSITKIIAPVEVIEEPAIVEADVEASAEIETPVYLYAPYNRPAEEAAPKGYTVVSTRQTDLIPYGIISYPAPLSAMDAYRYDIKNLNIQGFKVGDTVQYVYKGKLETDTITQMNDDETAYLDDFGRMALVWMHQPVKVETPRACSCGQLLNADETKCATCIYWNAQGLKRPSTKLVMGRDGIVLGILQDGEAEALEIKLPPFNPGPLKFISDETDQEIIERLKREIAQLMDEKAALEKQIKQVKTYQHREEDFEDWKTDKPYEDRGEEGKGIFF